MYTLEELIRAAQKIFGASPVLVEAALRAAGRDKFALDEAKLLVKKFANHEVKK